MQLPITTNLTDLSRQERLRLWMHRNSLTFAALGRQLDLTGNAISKLCSQATMPTRRHAELIALGVPDELLPQALDIKPGPKPRPQSTTVSSHGAPPSPAGC